MERGAQTREGGAIIHRFSIKDMINDRKIASKRVLVEIVVGLAKQYLNYQNVYSKGSLRW